MHPGADDRRHQKLLPEVLALDTGLRSLPHVLNSLELSDELGDRVSQSASAKSPCVLDTFLPLGCC